MKTATCKDVPSDKLQGEKIEAVPEEILNEKKQTIHQEDQTEEERDTMSISLSKSLIKKLYSISKNEGVHPNDLARELIAEGLVLRVWEIFERDQTMRHHVNNQNHRNSYQNNGNRHFNKSQENHRKKSFSSNRSNRSNYNTIMEDKGAFLEYVRSQERKTRRSKG